MKEATLAEFREPLEVAERDIGLSDRITPAVNSWSSCSESVGPSPAFIALYSWSSDHGSCLISFFRSA